MTRRGVTTRASRAHRSPLRRALLAAALGAALLAPLVTPSPDAAQAFPATSKAAVL